MQNSENNPTILIIEDDPDQMNLLANFTISQIKTLSEDVKTNAKGKQRLSDIRILKITNISSLRKAVSMYKNVFLAVLDCNIPDTRDSVSHDQLVKTNHRITGQHNSVDILIEKLPNTPITMISSLGRFQKIVLQHYENKPGVNINFIRKNDQSMINTNIGEHLAQYLTAVDGLS